MSPLAWPLWWAIRAYQYLLSPFWPNACRYEPSCSRYAQEALVRHGVWRGTGLALWRLLRCNPWAGGGDDPVPPAAPAAMRIDAS